MLRGGVTPAAFWDLLRELAAGRPLLVCVDDVHHWDAASLDALGFAARRLGRRTRRDPPDRCRGDGENGAGTVRGGRGEGFAGESSGLLGAVFAGLPSLRLARCPAAPRRRSSTTSWRAARRSGRPAVRAELLGAADGNPRLLAELVTVLTPGQLAGHEPPRGRRRHRRRRAARPRRTPAPPARRHQGAAAHRGGGAGVRPYGRGARRWRGRGRRRGPGAARARGRTQPACLEPAERAGCCARRAAGEAAADLRGRFHCPRPGTRRTPAAWPAPESPRCCSANPPRPGRRTPRAGRSPRPRHDLPPAADPGAPRLQRTARGPVRRGARPRPRGRGRRAARPAQLRRPPPRRTGHGRRRRGRRGDVRGARRAGRQPGRTARAGAAATLAAWALARADLGRGRAEEAARLRPLVAPAHAAATSRCGCWPCPATPRRRYGQGRRTRPVPPSPSSCAGPPGEPTRPPRRKRPAAGRCWRPRRSPTRCSPRRCGCTSARTGTSNGPVRSCCTARRSGAAAVPARHGRICGRRCWPSSGAGPRPGPGRRATNCGQRGDGRGGAGTVAGARPGLSARGPAHVLAELTPQQQRIARYVAEGATNREVAVRLSLSPARSTTTCGTSSRRWACGPAWSWRGWWTGRNATTRTARPCRSDRRGPATSPANAGCRYPRGHLAPLSGRPRTTRYEEDPPPCDAPRLTPGDAPAPDAAG
ncbi:hypothetical protein NKH77_13905 [Streptomyces sp. M19]